MADTGGALLLAAGQGVRFGADKRLHVLDDGDPVVLATARRYTRVFDRCIVVLRPGEYPIAQLLTDALGEQAPAPVYAADASRGMGHSLASGVAEIADWDYVFVALADMPFVAIDTLHTLKQAMSKDLIVVPTYDDEAGHPVGFGNELFAELGQLKGDSGARRVIAANPARVRRIPVSDHGVLRDIDRPEDLEADDSR